MDAWHAALADAHRQGSPYSLSGIHIWRGYTHIAARRAARRVRRPRGGGRGVPALRLQRRTSSPTRASFLVRALTERGELARARALLSLVPQGALDERVAGSSALPQCAAGAARRGGSLGRGPGRCRGCPARDRRVGQPAGASLAVAVGAGAGSTNGSREEALGLVSAELADARAFGAPGAVGRVLRALFEVTGDLAALREAVAVLEGSPARLELAKALCALGEASGDVRRAPPRPQPRARLRRHPGRRPRPRRARRPRRRARRPRRRRPHLGRTPRPDPLPRRRPRPRDRRDPLPRALRGHPPPHLGPHQARRRPSTFGRAIAGPSSTSETLASIASRR